MLRAGVHHLQQGVSAAQWAPNDNPHPPCPALTGEGLAAAGEAQSRGAIPPAVPPGPAAALSHAHGGEVVGTQRVLALPAGVALSQRALRCRTGMQLSTVVLPSPTLHHHSVIAPPSPYLLCSGARSSQHSRHAPCGSAPPAASPGVCRVGTASASGTGTDVPLTHRCHSLHSPVDVAHGSPGMGAGWGHAVLPPIDVAHAVEVNAPTCQAVLVHAGARHHVLTPGCHHLLLCHLLCLLTPPPAVAPTTQPASPHCAHPGVGTRGDAALTLWQPQSPRRAAARPRCPYPRGAHATAAAPSSPLHATSQPAEKEIWWQC